MSAQSPPSRGSPAQRQRTVLISSFTAFAVMAISALLGLQLLEFFGISLASFQVGGGMLLLTSALSMLNAQPAESRANAQEVHDAQERAAVGASIAVVPLTIPLLAAPIARVLGRTGINVMTRLMGPILAALAVEVMSDGLHKLFPGLG